MIEEDINCPICGSDDLELREVSPRPLSEREQNFAKILSKLTPQEIELLGLGKKNDSCKSL